MTDMGDNGFEEGAEDAGPMTDTGFEQSFTSGNDEDIKRDSDTRSRSRSRSRSPAVRNHHDDRRRGGDRGDRRDRDRRRDRPQVPQRSQIATIIDQRTGKPRRVNYEYCVFISNICYEVGWSELKTLLNEKVGPVAYVETFNDADGKPVGCAFVEFKEKEFAQKCVQSMEKYDIRGRKLVVKMDLDGHYSGKFRRRKEQDMRAQQLLTPQLLRSLDLDPDCLTDTIFVANLYFKMDWRDIKDVFKVAGPIERVEIFKDKDMKSKGLATIKYESVVDAVNAICMLNGRVLHSREIHVRMNRERNEPVRGREPPKPKPVPIPRGLDSVGPSLEQLAQGGGGGGGGRGRDSGGRGATDNRMGGLGMSPGMGGMGGMGLGGMGGVGMGTGTGLIGGGGLGSGLGIGSLGGMQGLGGGLNTGLGSTGLGGLGMGLGVGLGGGLPGSSLGMGSAGSGLGGLSGLSGGGLGGLSNLNQGMGSLGGMSVRGLGGNSSLGGLGGGLGDMGRSSGGLDRLTAELSPRFSMRDDPRDMGQSRGGGGGGGFGRRDNFALDMRDRDMDRGMGRDRGGGGGDRGMVDRNMGDRNMGDRNMGDRSMGDRNMGDRNMGDRNDRDRGRSSGGGNLAGTPKENGCQVFVRNLPFSVDWNQLKESFKDIGRVMYADVKTDEQNRSKGYGTVRFERSEEAYRAISIMNGRNFKGRMLDVSLDRY